MLIPMLVVGRQVWKDALSSKAEAPYLNHEVHGTLRSLAFCPYEDVLAAGHSEGISTVRFYSLICLIPGRSASMSATCGGLPAVSAWPDGEPGHPSPLSNPWNLMTVRRSYLHQQL